MDHFLDARGLKCPLPVLRTNKAIRTLAPGDILAVETTDAAAPEEFRAFCETTGHELLSAAAAGGVFTFRIRRVG